jgi:HEAT repeat protein
MLLGDIMDTEEALAFLRSHQPLPPDTLITEELLKEYSEVRNYFRRSPDPRCIPLFLNSFGQGSGFGTYQLVEDVIKQFSADEVVPHLIAALQNGSSSVRYWCAQIAANFPQTELIDPLRDLLLNGDEDGRTAAVTALEFIRDDRVDSILQQALKRELSDYVREFIAETVEARESEKLR